MSDPLVHVGGGGQQPDATILNNEPCMKCGYNRRGLEPSAKCPECGTDPAELACVKCGYNLRGLAASSKCSECGTPVQDSLRGILLQYANPEYLRTVLTGHSWVLNAILLLVVVTIGGFVLAVSSPFMRGIPADGVRVLITGAGLLVSVWSFLGYLKLTEPDPKFSGVERPDSARTVVRVAAIVSIVVNTLSTLLSGIVLAGGGMPAAIMMIVPTVLSLIGMIAFAVQFFAMMNYMIWLGKRVPDAWIVKRARTYRWLLPIFSTVGVLLIGLGPLIALVLYWNLLDRMRKHLKSIVTKGQPATLKGTFA